MGVPGFFAWLNKKYDNIIFSKSNLNINFDILLIDTNCLIHPCCFKILNDNPDWNDQNDLEYKMINYIIEYLNKIISFINPKQVYIAIDGVAPFAKIKHQRYRRYKSVKENEMINNLKKKYNKPINKFWSNACITPSTEFMNKLHQKIEQYIKENKYIYSSCYEPAEGEHKILQYMKKNEYINYIIYGLDADLIFLGLASNKNNIYLLRESKELELEDNEYFRIVNLENFKNDIFIEIKNKIKDKNIISEEQILKDFIVICYLLGNDFIPSLPSINIKSKTYGIDFLIEQYIRLLNEKLYEYTGLIINNKINGDFFFDFIKNLSEFEDIYFEELNTKRKFFKIDSNLTDPYDIEKYKLQNLLFKINNPIKLGSDLPDLWKTRWYEVYFHINTHPNEMKIYINQICQNYIDGILWTYLYYFDNCADWHWCYKYHEAPFTSDIIWLMKEYKICLDTKFEENKPLTEIQQLLCVIPPQISYLLPKKYQTYLTDINSPIIHYCPIDFRLNMLYKDKFWQTYPEIPMIDINDILNLINAV
jgi:5'-3' exonuclease